MELRGHPYHQDMMFNPELLKEGFPMSQGYATTRGLYDSVKSKPA
jgi:hypothetical protein